MSCVTRACLPGLYQPNLQSALLKMDDERVTQIGEASMLPNGFGRTDIRSLSGEALSEAYDKRLETFVQAGRHLR